MKYAQKPSSESRKGLSVCSSPDKDGDSGLTLGAPATNKEGMALCSKIYVVRLVSKKF